MDLGGVYPALTTPYAADGEVSLADVKYNIERYNSTGIAGFVVLGSTGESVLLSRERWTASSTTVRDAAGQGKRLIAGTGAESTQDTIERTKRAAEIRIPLRACEDAALLQARVQAGRFDCALSARGGCVADSSAARTRCRFLPA